MPRELIIREPLARDFVTLRRLPFRATKSGKILPPTTRDFRLARTWLVQLGDVPEEEIDEMLWDEFEHITVALIALLANEDWSLDDG